MYIMQKRWCKIYNYIFMCILVWSLNLSPRPRTVKKTRLFHFFVGFSVWFEEERARAPKGLGNHNGST